MARKEAQLVRKGPVADLIKEAERLGCELIRNGRTGHSKLRAPNGKKFTLSTTPCKGNRAGKNERANLRRWLRTEAGVTA